MKTLLLFVVSFFLCSSIFAQHEGLGQIVETVLHSKIIRPYLPKDSSNLPAITCLVSESNIPTRISVRIGDRLLPVYSEADGHGRNCLHLNKLVWRDELAKVKLRGGSDFRAKFKLRLLDDEWEITGAFLRGTAWKRGKRMQSWDFLF